MLLTVDQALALLAKAPEKYQPQINFIRSNPTRNIELFDSTLLIRGTSDRDWVYLCSSNPRELARATALLTKEDINFALLEEWMIPIVTKGRDIEWQMTSRRLVLPLTTPLPPQNIATTPLLPEEAQFIHQNWPYANVTTLEYTRARIERGLSAAVRDGQKKPVAWAITHDDGAIGFLYVTDQYRGLGYAQGVTAAIAQELKNQGQIAWVNIEPDNLKSLTLASKLGFVDTGIISWLGLAPVKED